MIKVNTDVLRSRSAEMQTDISRIKMLLMGVWTIRSQMQEYESLKEACLMLKSWTQKAEEELDSYRKLQRLTAAVANKYERSEKTVLRRVEQYTVRRYPPTIIAVQLPSSWSQLIGPGTSTEDIRKRILEQTVKQLAEEKQE